MLNAKKGVKPKRIIVNIFGKGHIQGICPKCNNTEWEYIATCKRCGQEFDWE